VNPPLRLPWPRVRLWSLALFGIGIAPIVGAPLYGFHDWPAFWTAGHLVGTPDIVSAEATIAWQGARGLSLAIFPYPPPAALLLWPFAQLPLDISFWLHAAAMLACAVGAAILAARIYGLSRDVAILAALAWTPVTGAVAIGQNTPFALLLAMLALSGLVNERAVGAGAAVAGLLYKPTIGLPMAGLLLLRARWRAALAVAVGVAAWYLLGIVAAGGSPGWPGTWLRTVGSWLADDAIRNADKAISLPGLVARVGAPDAIGYAAAALLIGAAIPRLRRAPGREAVAGTLLIGVAASPHAWSYEAVLLLPFLWWVLAGGIAEPWRTRLILAAYVLAPLWMVSRQTGISAVAVIVLGASALWLSGRARSPGPVSASPEAA
jgi:hypothetical protein